jgi:NitT/TauT family transport system ATP-binding protein
LIFQQSTLFAWLTVRENIEFALKEDQPDTSARRARARELLQLVGLQGFEKERPRALSGGMAQRLALARALATAPRVLLLDEPFGALDAVSRGEMHAVLLRVWSSLGMGVLFVTHDVDEAVVLADRVLIMSRRPTHIVGEYAIDLPRPRVAGGIRCRGFEDRRNEVVRAAHELFSERLS